MTIKNVWKESSNEKGMRMETKREMWSLPVDLVIKEIQ